jgi:mannose/fructose-specific phosphotransferase system component IIA
MSELRGVIVSHAAVAKAMVDAVTAITGIEGALTPISNEGCGTAELGDRLRDAVGSGPAVLFVDLPGGSCFTSSARYAKQGGADIAVVTGVNLAMLLDFVFNRDISPAEAARRAVDAGGKAIHVTRP